MQAARLACQQRMCICHQTACTHTSSAAQSLEATRVCSNSSSSTTRAPNPRDMHTRSPLRSLSSRRSAASRAAPQRLRRQPTSISPRHVLPLKRVLYEHDVHESIFLY